MAEPESGVSTVVGDVNRNLGAFFRHLLPGVYILGAAYVAHPSWFAGMDAKSWQHLAVAAVVALTAGNIWFSLNRYGVHQIIDYVVYLTKSQGPAASSKPQYLEDLGVYVANSLHAPALPESARQHVAFRASSVLLIYTVGEVAVVFAFWHEPDTFFSRYSLPVLLASILVLAVGVWQNVITRRIDYHVVNRRDQEPPNTAALESDTACS